MTMKVRTLKEIKHWSWFHENKVLERLLSDRATNIMYRIAAKYSNNSVFQHWFKQGCRITT